MTDNPNRVETDVREEKAMIQNPVLRGFHPDANAICVDGTYYMAVSTFEWLPGVDIYASKDLVNWELADSPLKENGIIDLQGNYNSGSIWAPHLSYSDGKFWLILTDVKTTGAYKDTLNYLITTDKIGSEWSKPVFLNASGFDPCFFHDDDGRHYLINMLFDHRPNHKKFAGLVIQEYDAKEQKMIGERTHFYTGTDLGVCEGPQMLKKDGWYYLLCAAGGTGYSHAATVCRSKDLMGPYEISPYHPLLTTKPYEDSPLQKSGHAAFVEAAPDEWYIFHICARPLEGKGRGNCPLGRETSIQKIEWIDGCPRLANGTNKPDLMVEKPSIGKDAVQKTDFSTRTDFDEKEIPDWFKTLRIPFEQTMSLDERDGWLRIFGRESLLSLHRQSLIARRFQHFCFTAETKMEFNPTSFQQGAGLILFYDTDNWDYLEVTYDEELASKMVWAIECRLGKTEELSKPVPVADDCPLRLAVKVDYDQAQFFFAQGDAPLEKIGRPIHAGELSEDYVKANGKLGFTGAMVGLCAQDMDAHESFADFDYFSYTEDHS